MVRSRAGRSAGLTLLLLSLAFPGLGAAGESLRPTPDALLDLPYLSQTEQLCGGAAVAMVLRYWGARDVFPQDFASLVDHATGGIHTDALTRAVVARGWQADVVPPDGTSAIDRVRVEVNKGRPIIALIEDSPQIYHYVVVVGVTDNEVVLHDPARAPYRVVSRADFDRQWTAANRWMLLVLPTSVAPVAAPRPSLTTSSVAVASTTPCDALVADSVTLARDGKLADAERGLVVATSLCPTAASGWHELAGLRFIQHRYDESAVLAERAVALAPHDLDLWRLLATSRYLQSDLTGALAAWNQLDEPRVDTVTVEGVERTHHPAVVHVTRLVPRQLLTPEVFRHAARRLAELPAASTTTLRYRATDGETAAITAVVVERSVVPHGAAGWGAVGLGAAFRREVAVDVSSLAGQGEVFGGAYRWAKNRPRVRFALAMPAPGPLPGIVDVDASWQRQAYEPTSVGAPPIREEERRAGAHLSDWATSWLRWQAGGAVDRFGDRGYVAFESRLQTRSLDDHVATTFSFARWAAATGSPGFSSGAAATSWRSTRTAGRPAFVGTAGVMTASASAPLALWPVAGSSNSRGVMLRAHPLFEEGIITSDVIGRRLAFATSEYNRPVYGSASGSASVAGFVDIARVWQRRDAAGPSPILVDIGAGVRLNTPAAGGQIRIDVAYGLENHHTGLSAGYVTAWGR